MFSINQVILSSQFPHAVMYLKRYHHTDVSNTYISSSVEAACLMLFISWKLCNPRQIKDFWTPHSVNQKPLGPDHLERFMNKHTELSL